MRAVASMTAAQSMIAVAAMPHERARLRQNWLLGPLQDGVFVIAAPLLVLALSLAVFRALGARQAGELIIGVHIIMTVAHHLPTFIRIYGDVELFDRFRWTFLLAPLVPLAFSAAVLSYLAYRQLPAENFLYLFILLVLWDPWHFLMQHYGFMRIYDRHNAAPARIAARMDLGLCAGWFLFGMLAAGDWLSGLAADLFLTANLPLYAALPAALVDFATALAAGAALTMTLVYIVYLAWCRQRGWFVSPAKLALTVTTFGVLLLAYTPNEWMLAAAPGWTFKVGFAVVGIVHMTQYLAIVWRYNRNLAGRPGRARAGWFMRLHARGGVLLAGVYVCVCLAYGTGLSTSAGGRLAMSVLMALGFTSTLLHYYFDGFIWKLREARNREHLELGRASAPAAPRSGRGPARSFVRQLVWFGLPMALLSGGALSVWNGAGAHYSVHMLLAQQAYQHGDAAAALDSARRALAEMRRELPLAQRLVELDPDSANQAALALLMHDHARYAWQLLPRLTGMDADPQKYRQGLAEAIAMMQRALAHGTSPAHPYRENMSIADARRLLQAWQRELDDPG